MYKILYVVRYPINDFLSIRQKIDGQIQGMQELGHEVSFLCYDKSTIYLCVNGKMKEIARSFLLKFPFYYHIFSYYDLYHYANKEVKRTKYDVVYFRSSPLNANAIMLFKNASKNAKVVVEKPTYLAKAAEKRGTIMRRIYAKYSSLLWKVVSKNVSLFVLIGDKASELYNKPAVNIDNGVSIQQIPMKKDIKMNDGKKHLLAVASMSYWQGYDRLIESFSAWDSEKKKEYIIDLVGNDGDGSLIKWKELVNRDGLQNQVFFHGPKTGDDLTYFFDIATIGISSLGNYRRGITSGSVLKLREYMARGLPFVYAHDDPDINDEMDWCLRVPNDSSLLDMDQIDEFINKISKCNDISERMRTYAKNHMTWSSQLKNVFDVIEQDY